MNFDQIYKKAESESGYLSDNSSINIYIASRIDDPSVSAIHESFDNCINDRNIDANIITAGSLGCYDLEPMVIIKKPERPFIFYNNFKPELVAGLADDYFAGDNPRKDLAFCAAGPDKTGEIPSFDDLPFYKMQSRITLRNCGYIDPENIDHYILRGGFTGLNGALKMSQADTIDKLYRSGLRGRGGAGYITADKWKALLENKNEEKYVICNAADSDPKAFTARLLLTGDPYSVLEGMLISAYATGSCKCILFVDSEYKSALNITSAALSKMMEYGLLGSGILDSGYNCEIEIRASGISAVAGEETALLRSLENKQPMPYLRPPFPDTKGLNGKPVIINNIETFSNITAVFQFGPEKISSIGTEKSKGTKLVTIADCDTIKYTVEIPFGTSLQTLVENYKTISDDTNIKAIQFGGPTGAYIANDEMGIIIDYDKINEKSVIGSGTLELIYDTECAVESAKKKMSYLHDQSCGKCVFCREGSLQMAVILGDIAEGTAKPEDIDLLNEIGGRMKTGCICSFGKTAANPVLSSLASFRKEYDDHIKEKKCLVKTVDQ